MECKETQDPDSPLLDIVLIETLWNVKLNKNNRFVVCDLVLIETLWNVKKSPIGIHIQLVTCINRNIVECKETFQSEFEKIVSLY